MPTARIRRGTSALALPERPRPELLDLVVGDGAGGTATLEAALAATSTDALVVLHDGALALDWRAPHMPHGATHLLCSVSKSITALLAGALIGAGRLAEDDPVERHVPEAAGGGFADATVRDLLDMTASIRFVEDYSPGVDVREYREASGWRPGPPDGPGLHAYLAACGPDGPHGQRFRYLSPTSDMLGWVCERAAGRPYAEALAALVWAPLGAGDDADVTLDRYRAARAAGGICTTPHDLARVGQLLVDGGRDVLPSAFVDDIFDGGDPRLWALGDFASFLPGGAYRSSWYAPRTQPGVVCGIGIHGQLLYVDRVRRVVVAKLSTWPEPDDETGDAVAIAISAAIAAAL